MSLDSEQRRKLEALGNARVIRLVEEAIALCKPDRVSVVSDSPEDLASVRAKAIAFGEETPLRIPGHTIHFDSALDQARDKAHTALLLSEPVDFGFETEIMERAPAIEEITAIFDGAMKGHEMFVRFFCLGPTESPFALRALQITDSAYVAHSEDLLYRQGYEEFRRQGASEDFFYFLHSSGELENAVTKDVSKRRVYVDIEHGQVLSVNTQYAGNTVGLKKLAFRLAIRRAHREGWLAEHMFLMGVHGKPGRVTYFAGAFPSACGKTSTAMIPGQTMVGDDLIYLREIDGLPRAVNVESGVFGIIQDVNPEDDPAIYEALTTEGEVIFSNVLVSEQKPYWLGMKQDYPPQGINHQGEWHPGKLDAKGKPVDVSHKNARYTISIATLPNRDPALHEPMGVVLPAIIYGGRDSDTSVPIVQASSWAHGVLLGATVESETTAAALGKEGVRVHNPFANLDFMSVPLAEYTAAHFSFAQRLKQVPEVFGTNYFLKSEDGRFLNHKLDKKVWILWAEARVNGEVDAIQTPVGWIPRYEDLASLFKSALDKEYSREAYREQFRVRIEKYIEKMERMKAAFSKIAMPEAFTAELEAQAQRLYAARTQWACSSVDPERFDAE
ncbi:MAG: phosphoenolpyruvate carboxykinase (GTP) [Myxococcota bacterium]|jgi:phosphoenolpyruvate carboxykinase (GTP)|nr:phosphoenolpyruvate carboxykinase (GTP) [Myxococcota bacterium]